MQPCPVCGAVTIDPAGYCTQCGSFRGPVDPGAAGPYGAPGYPTSGGPGYPTSGAPGYPVSGGPGYPTTGGAGYGGAAAGPPGYPPPGGAGYPSGPGYPVTGFPGPPANPGGRSRAFVAPLIALSATLVVLVVAIVVVVLVRGSDDDPGVAGASPSVGVSRDASPSPSADPDIDPCVVGRWRVSSHVEDVPMDGVGKVKFSGGENATVNLTGDGRGWVDYGSGTVYEGRAQGHTYRLQITGRISYDFTARDGTVSFENVTSTGRVRIYVDGEQVGSESSFDGSDDPTKYECSGDTLVQTTALMEIRLRKL